MRAVVQRVKKATVKVENEVVGKINNGLLIFLGVGQGDTESDLDYLVNKIIGLRIFQDEMDKMNLSIDQVNGEILAVSQFTLYGDVRKGRRPSFTESASPEKGEKFYHDFISKIKEKGIYIESGRFGADMDVELINDGPVTILLDSNKNF